MPNFLVIFQKDFSRSRNVLLSFVLLMKGGFAIPRKLLFL